MSDTQIRTYKAADVVRFRKTAEAFGGLSNMAPGFPIRLMGLTVRTSEALYQACRFPHMPDVQRMILSEGSPMTAKMRSKPYRKDSREDWDDVRVRVMRWCLRVKLICNWGDFSTLLLSTGTLPIVEDSRKDRFWGAVWQDDEILIGENVLGRLLMELREKLRDNPASVSAVQPLKIPNFYLLDDPIPFFATNPAEPVVDSGAQVEPTSQPAFF